MNLYLRMARNSPGKPFNFQQAWKVMKKMDAKYFHLSITQIEDQVKTKTVFPAPGLQDKQGHDSKFRIVFVAFAFADGMFVCSAGMVSP